MYGVKVLIDMKEALEQVELHQVLDWYKEKYKDNGDQDLFNTQVSRYCKPNLTEEQRLKGVIKRLGAWVEYAKAIEILQLKGLDTTEQVSVLAAFQKFRESFGIKET